MKTRRASLHRKTGETDIRITLNVDGTGKSKIHSGIPFFDHMLTLFSKHSLIDLDLQIKGDLEVDFHHTVEDTGIAIGQALTKALGDKSSMVRYGFWLLPMDETLVRVALDFSGRPYLDFRVPKKVPMIRLKAGDFPAQLLEEFLRGIVQQAGLTLHVEVLETKEVHHLIEGVFKGLARALGMALERKSRIQGIPSTKGIL